MARFDVAGTAPQDAPGPARQDAAWTPSVQANVMVPLAQAAVQGGLAAVAALCAGLALFVGLHLLGVSLPWYVYALALPGSVLVFVGITWHIYPERQAVIDDALYKRETQTGQDLNGDGVVGPPPARVIPVNNWRQNLPPAQTTRPEFDKADLRRFIGELYRNKSYAHLRTTLKLTNDQILKRLEYLAKPEWAIVLFTLDASGKRSVMLPMPERAALAKLEQGLEFASPDIYVE